MEVLEEQARKMTELQAEHNSSKLTIGDMQRQIREKDNELELVKEAMEKF